MTIRPMSSMYAKLNEIFNDVSKLESTVPNYLHETLTEDDYSILSMLYGWDNEKADGIVLQGKLMGKHFGKRNAYDK